MPLVYVETNAENLLVRSVVFNNNVPFLCELKNPRVSQSLTVSSVSYVAAYVIYLK